MRLSLDRLWLVIAIGLPVLIALLVPLPTVDLAYQVRAGDEILRTAAIPGVDTWTFTVAGTPWTDQQWLAQVALALGHRAGGWELLAVVRAGLVGAAIGCCIASSMARGAGPRMAAILALLVFALSAPALALRPQLFGIVLFAALLWLIATRHEHPRRLLGGPAARAPVGQPARLVRARPARPRLRVAGRRRPRPAVEADPRRARRRPPGDAREPVRSLGVGVRRGHRRQPRDHRARQRVAAHHAVHRARRAVLRLGRRDAGRAGPWPLGPALAGLAVDRGDARDRRLDGARPRVVAVRRRVRGRGRAPGRAREHDGSRRRNRTPPTEPAGRDPRPRVRPRHPRRAAVVAAVRPPHRAGRAC